MDLKFHPSGVGNHGEGVGNNFYHSDLFKNRSPVWDPDTLARNHL